MRRIGASWRWLALVLLTLHVQPLAAQNAFVLHLGREGNATVMVAAQDRVAFITDGGRRTGGITDAAVDGQHILDLLRDNNIETLVITCSHPHADHLEGLVALVTHRDFPTLPLQRLFFVDAGLEMTPNDARSLYQRYRAHWNEPQQQKDLAARKLKPPPVPARIDATNKDAFADIRRLCRTVSVENLEYQPQAQAGDHGRAVLVTYTLGTGANARRLTDFDDADDHLVQEWFRWAKQDPKARRPFAMIMPHHGTRPQLTDPRPLMDPDVRPEYVIFSVNQGNRYLHPDPETVALCLERLGAEHVLFTTDPRNIEITPAGLQRNNNVVPLVQFMEALRFQRDEILATTDALRDKAMAEQLTVREKISLKRNQRWLGWWAHVERRWVRGLDEGPGPGGQSPWPVGDSPPRPDLPPGGLAVVPDWRPPTPPPPPELPRNTGSFRRMIAANHAALRRFEILHPAIGGPAGSPIQRMRLFRPRVGGVAFGNTFDPGGLTVLKAELVMERDADGADHPALRIKVRDKTGKVAEALYRDFTPTDLWVAGRFVSPPDSMKQWYQLRDGETALAGINENMGDHWKFNLHPAIANTPLARETMRLDMVLAHPKRPAVLGKVPPFKTYQWYDAPAKIGMKDGRIRVEAASGPPDFLLRNRLWVAKTPEWAKGMPNLGKAFDEELNKRLTKRVLQEEFADPEKYLATRRRLDDLFQQTKDALDNEEGGKSWTDAERLRQTADHLEKLAGEEGEAFAGDPMVQLEIANLRIRAKLQEDRLPVDEAIERLTAFAKEKKLLKSNHFRVLTWEWEIEAQLESELGEYVEFDAQSRIAPLREVFAPAQRLDRFARLVAVLRWIRRDTGVLPDFDGLAPIRVKVPAMFRFADVLSSEDR
jgi:hypothetical protein